MQKKNYERKRYLKDMSKEDEPEVVEDILSAVTEVIPDLLRASVPMPLYREAQAHDISILHSTPMCGLYTVYVL